MKKSVLSRSKKKMYPPLYANQLHIFDNEKNIYQEQQIQQKRRITPKQTPTKYDMQSTQRFLLTRPRSTNPLVDECFVNQILKRSDPMQIPRQVSPLRYKVSGEEPLMQAKRSVTTLYKEDHVGVLLTDTNDEYVPLRSGRMRVATQSQTPKFQNQGRKTGFPTVKSDPITQGIDYRKLNISPEPSPLRKPRYKWQDELFFKRGFGVFEENPSLQVNPKKYHAQRSSKVRELINQENLTPSPKPTKQHTNFRGDEMGRLMKTDTSPITPRVKNNKDFTGDGITKLLTGTISPPSPRPTRQYEYGAQRQNYNIFRQEVSEPQCSTPKLTRNDSQNMKSLLQQSQLQ